jgi:hypothetical protein
MIEQKYKVMRVRVLAFGLKSRIMFVCPTVGPTRGGYFIRYQFITLPRMRSTHMQAAVSRTALICVSED